MPNSSMHSDFDITLETMIRRKFMITLIRHGETLANRQKIMQGQMDTQLSDLGIQQAQLVANRLEDEKFTHIFSSDLARAAVTAQTILAANKFFTGKLVLDTRLRERGFGDLEGKYVSEYRKAAEAANISMEKYVPEGAETIKQVTDRAIEFLDHLCSLIAEPLIHDNDTSTEEPESNTNHTSQSCTNTVDEQCQSYQKMEAHSSGLLHVDIPDSQRFSEQKTDRCDDSDERPTSSSSASGIGRSDISNSAKKNECFDSSSIPSVLIVSHGLLLRELKLLLIDKYDKQLVGGNAKNAGRICPNTGVSQFTMIVFIKNEQVCVKCDQVHFISNISHLESSSDDLLSHAKFQGAL